MTAHRIAFALSGLAGSNAHGAGFLAAAQRIRQRTGAGAGPPDGPVRRVRADRRILPELELISCTSGTIAVAAGYLRGEDLRADLEQQIAAVDRATGLPHAAWADPWRGPLLVLWTGLPGVFGPWREAITRHLVHRALEFATPGSGRFGTVPTGLDELLDLWLPARMLVPKLTDAFFDRTAATFNDPAHGVGVCCNSFDPAAGVEYLYANDAAMRLIRAHHDPAAGYDTARDRAGVRTVYRPITADGLRAALWLFWYGFRARVPAGEQHVDGAYARSIILDELTVADRIYAVKPINHRWLGRLPRNALELQDMQTELWLGSSYREQARLIDTVNALLAQGRLTGTGKRYHPIDLVPVEIAVQRGFFTYFVEDPDVFEAGYEQGLEALDDAT